MEIKKTTLLSALVCVAGILAEIMFHDVLSTSVPGVVLSIALAVIVLVAAYFVLDGLYAFLTVDREKNKKHQEEYEQRIYSILNELLQFEKAVYKEVHALQQMESEHRSMDMTFNSMQQSSSMFEESAPQISEERLQQLENMINEHTTMTAKIIAKYVNRNTEDIKALIEKEK